MFLRPAAVTVAVAALLLLAACDGSLSRGTRKGVAELKVAASCREVAEEMRAQALVDMNRQLDENLRRALDRPLCSTLTCDGVRTMAAGPQSPSGPQGGVDSSTPREGAKEYSGTNNQVSGVDEADFVKNDGRYIYLLSGNKLKVFDAFPPEQAHLVSELELEGVPSKLFVHEGRATVFVRGAASSFRPCTYGYDCEFSAEPGPLSIVVVDLSSVAAPRVVRKVRTGGGLLAARRVGDAVHAVVAFGDVPIEGLSYWPEGAWSCGPEDSLRALWLPARFDELRQRNADIIARTDFMTALPVITDVRLGETVEEEEQVLADCRDFFISQQQDGRAVMSLLSFNPRTGARVRAASVVGRPGVVYASGEALYLASRHRGDREGFFGTLGTDEATTVHQFSLTSEPPSAEYIGSGVVKGHVLNQFALDRHQGFLRIATSNGRVPDPDVHSTLTVLALREGKLVEVGRVDHLAPGEDIRSVRFDGDRGYVVTFKKTDPLFTFDLSNPAAPRAVGELKIPGFSTYMHKLDDGHLLTVGYDAEDQGSFAYFQGVLLQVFDVTDLANPRLTHREVIGTRGTSSDATTNHLAFNYFAPKGLLALPMALCEESTGGASYGTRLTFSGLMVFGVSTEAGFSFRGGVAHQPPEETAGGACGSWWTSPDTHVKRSIFMDDHVYSVAADSIHVQHLDALGTDVKVLGLAPPPP